MKIVYDWFILWWQKAGGINRYYEELISRLPPDWQPIVLGSHEARLIVPHHPRLSASPMSTVRPQRHTQRLKTAWWKLRHVRQADVFHPTYYQLMGGLRFSDVKCPLLVTVHDFAYACYPRLADHWDVTVRAQSEAIERADRLICVSRSTENMLLERFPHKAGKTTVIPLAASFVPDPARPAAPDLEHPTFLFVGGRMGYKNFLFLLRAFARASESHPNIRLHVAGAPLYAEERWQIHLLGISDRVIVSEYPDQQRLEELYRTSVALLYPSLHEGFGMPPLEAMACGTIAVTSNSTSLPEVLGNAAILLDPRDEGAWIDCIRAIADNAIPRQELIARGAKRVASFSWDTTAAKHIEVYREMG